MSQLKEYLVSYKSIEYGEHTFSYKIGDAFFEVYNNTEIQKAELSADVFLNKKSTHIEIKFNIIGKVSLICDRCLDPFEESIEIEQTIYIKTEEGNSDEDENLYFIANSVNELDLSEYIDELIVVALPMRRVHREDPEGNPTCNNNMVEYIQNINNEGVKVDPRWNELNKLRDGTS